MHDFIGIRTEFPSDVSRNHLSERSDPYQRPASVGEKKQIKNKHGAQFSELTNFSHLASYYSMRCIWLSFKEILQITEHLPEQVQGF